MVVLKGARIKMVCGGPNKGKVGWLSAQSTHTEKSYRVIFAEDENIVRTVRKTSVNILPDIEVAPSSYEDALFQQHDDVDLALDKVCEDLAKCGITNASPRLLVIFSQRVAKAYSKQLSKGHKALYRTVEWDYQDSLEGSMTIPSAADEEGGQ